MALVDLDHKIITILSIDSPATIRFLCALLFPRQSWHAAQRAEAAAVRIRCHLLCEQRILWAVGEDIFALCAMRGEVAHA